MVMKKIGFLFIIVTLLMGDVCARRSLNVIDKTSIWLNVQAYVEAILRHNGVESGVIVVAYGKESCKIRESLGFTSNSSKGRYDSKKDTVFVFLATDKFSEQWLSTLTHELIHAADIMSGELYYNKSWIFGRYTMYYGRKYKAKPFISILEYRSFPWECRAFALTEPYMLEFYTYLIKRI